MIWLALTATLAAASGAPVQDGTLPALDLYAPPPVRPFEAPPGLGEGPAQGDAADGGSRAPLTAPVGVDAYRGAYETSPTDSALAFDQGVAQAEISMDARMGPLDGRWSVRDASGAELFALILVDRDDGAVEGAWRSTAGRSDAGVIARTPLTAAGVTLQLGGGGALQLTRSGTGWTGAITADGRARPVTATQD